MHETIPRDPQVNLSECMYVFRIHNLRSAVNNQTSTVTIYNWLLSVTLVEYQHNTESG